MSKQGPGTKLVLKGLKRAFPKIAEKREQEEREEREREHASRKHCAERRQGSSRHSKPGHQEMHGQPKEHTRRGASVHPNAEIERNHKQPEDGIRSGSIRRGPSIRSNAVDRGSHHQSRDRTRSGSIRQGHSSHSNAGNGASHNPFLDNISQEDIRRRPSVRSNAGNPSNRASRHPLRDDAWPESDGSYAGNRAHGQNTDNESIHPSLSTEPRRRERGAPSTGFPGPTRRQARGAREEEEEEEEEEEANYTDHKRYRSPASRSQQPSLRQDGFSHASRASGLSFDTGPRRTASGRDAVGSREMTQTDERRPDRRRG